MKYIVFLMSIAEVLSKEKIVTLSELQKNPFRALEGGIIRIVKNGKEIGIYFSKEEFVDFLEERAELQPQFEAELKKIIKKSKREKLKPLSSL